jgi:hypothetical protein
VADQSPRRTARIAGGLYLIVFVTGALTLFLRSPLIVRSDAGATATNILASESIFRLSVALDLVASVCYIGVALFLYQLLRPVSRSVSLLAAFLALAGCIVGAAVSVTIMAPLVLLRAGPPLAAFRAEQIEALALLFTRLYTQGSSIGFVFFGCYCLTLGYLVARSAFLPRAIGVLLAVAGVGWLTNSFSGLLALPLGGTISPAMSAAAILGEAALTLWLLTRGVNAERWREQACPARETRA